MKKEIHPTYEKTTIVCACGNKIETKSTTPSEIHVELCSACHPFYTGKQKLVDTAGRVDKFMARRKKAAAFKSNIETATDKNTDIKKTQIDTDKSVKIGTPKESVKINGSPNGLEKIIAESEDVAVVEVAENGEVTVDEIPTHGVPEEKIERIEEELEEKTVDIAADSDTDKNTESKEPLVNTEKSDEK